MHLRELLESENQFNWDARRTAAFNKFKEMLKTAPVLHYFDEKKDSLIQTDAYQSGLVAIFFTIHALKETQLFCAQIEKEALSIGKIKLLCIWQTSGHQ